MNYTLGADIPYTIVDKSNPIMAGMTDITIFDEAFYNMTWAKDPAMHVLATAVIPGTPSAGKHKGEVVPQIWTYEHTLPGGQPAGLSSGCRGIPTPTMPTHRFKPCYCAASHGPERGRWMSWSITSPRCARLLAHMGAASSGAIQQRSGAETGTAKVV